jgi:hypothetical protein
MYYIKKKYELWGANTLFALPPRIRPWYIYIIIGINVILHVFFIIL